MKALRSLETGGLSYSDVLAETRELLEAGASPGELREILLGRDLIEPLSVQARVEMLDLLNGAILHERQGTAAPAENLNNRLPPPPPPSPDLEPSTAEAAAIARATALEADLVAARTALESERSKSRDAARAAAEAAADSLVSLETARYRADQALADAELYRTEVQSLRKALSERDASLGPLRQLLGKRDAQLAALSQEYTELSSTLEARTDSVAQLETDLQAAQARESALTADLGRARAALESELGRARVNSKSWVDRLASTEAALARAEEASRNSARYQTEAQTLRDTLATREADLAALQREHANQAKALEAHANMFAELEADLQMARTRADEASRNSARYETEAQTLRDRLATREADLAALQREHGNEATFLEAHATKIAQLEADLQTARARAEEASRNSARYQTEAQALRDRLATREADLTALQREHGNQVTALEARAKRSAQLEADLLTQRARADALSEELKATQKTAQGPQILKFQKVPPDPQNSTNAKVEPTPAARVPTATTVGEKSSALKFSAPRPAGARKKRASPRVVAAAVMAIIAVVAVWLFSRRTSAPVEAKAPVPLIQAPNPGMTIRDCPTCPAMTVLPAGRFKQGTPSDYGGAPSFEKPQHWVSIGKPFAMSTTPITVEEFGEFIAASGREVQGCDTYDGAWKHHADKNWKDPGFLQTGVHPVTCVSSNDAAAYAAWLSTQTGHRYRLPSASEWEYGARAGGEAVQPWGPIAADACRYANVADQSAADQYPGWEIFGCDDAYVNTSPVGTFEANAFGLKDMLGNVFQWTEDCWNADYTGAPVTGSARTDGDCTQRELRGGSWFSTPDYVRANYRNHFAADYRTSSVGIRLVRDIEP